MQRINAYDFGLSLQMEIERQFGLAGRVQGFGTPPWLTDYQSGRQYQNIEDRPWRSPSWGCDYCGSKVVGHDSCPGCGAPPSQS